MTRKLTFLEDLREFKKRVDEAKLEESQKQAVERSVAHLKKVQEDADRIIGDIPYRFQDAVQRRENYVEIEISGADYNAGNPHYFYTLSGWPEMVTKWAESEGLRHCAVREEVPDDPDHHTVYKLIIALPEGKEWIT